MDFAFPKGFQPSCVICLVVLNGESDLARAQFLFEGVRPQDAITGKGIRGDGDLILVLAARTGLAFELLR
jgi:hypothetical protein